MIFYALFTDKERPYLIQKGFRIMKLIFLLVFVSLMQLHAATHAQSVTLVKKNSQLNEIFKAIQQQTGIKFLYNNQAIQKAHPITVNALNQPLNEVLDQCFAGQPLTYTLFEGNIIVKEKTPSLMDKVISAIDRVTVKGKITDDNGIALPGITVREKGVENGTISDENGSFNITVTDKEAVLTFSSIGFETREIPASKFTKGFVLILKPNTMALKEVIVNKGYYTTTRELNTGNVSSVSAKTIAQQPVSNPMAALEGQVAGLFITQSTGVPGGGFNVQIRGQNSIANGNEPFYVIDGVPYSSSPQLLANNDLNPAVKPFGNSPATSGSPLNFINPNDIESIEVLKDADATAIYGSRGANGVILITTKKGKTGQTKIDFNVYQGIGKLTNNVKYVNTRQYLEMRHEAFRNDGAAPDPDVDFDVLGGNTWDTTRTNDWAKQLIGGSAHYTDAQGSISGGNDLTQYLIGGGYHRETTVFPGTASDQKGSMHFSISSSTTNKKLKIIFSGSYLVDQSNLPVIEPLTQLPTLAPDDPNPFNPDGSLNWANGTWQYDNNPYGFLKDTYAGHTNNLVANMVLSYNIVKGLDFKSSMGYTNQQMEQKNLYPLTSDDPLSGATSGGAYFNSANSRSWIIEPQLNYKLKIGRGQFSALVGTTFQQNRNEGNEIYANGYTSDLLLNDLQAASTISTLGVTDITYKYNAVYGRLNYVWDDKYIVNFTARRDGSSRFGPGKQFADFGAGGAAWIFSKEHWIKDHFDFLSFGKLRVSYGSSGNDQVPDYTFFDRYSPTKYPYGGSQGLYPISLYNPDLAWEVNKKAEAGLELGFLKDRLNLSISYYHNRSSNQLLGYALSAVTGFSSISENLPATVQNTGLELTVNSVIVKSGSFRWSSSVNLTIPHNKLIAYPDLATSSYRNQFIIGQPITIKQVYKYEGVDPQTGLYQFMGADGKLTSDPVPITDAISIVNTAPKFYGGYQNSFSYGPLSLDFLLQFVKQTGLNYIYNSPGYFSSYEPISALQRWQKPGDNALIQRYTTGLDDAAATALGDAYSSDQLYKDASYIRLKNLAFSYTLPGLWQQHLGIKNARLYLQGQNLFTITNYKGYDPENQTQYTLPPLKVWTIGLQVTL